MATYYSCDCTQCRGWSSRAQAMSRRLAEAALAVALLQTGCTSALTGAGRSLGDGVMESVDNSSGAIGEHVVAGIVTALDSPDAGTAFANLEGTLAAKTRAELSSPATRATVRALGSDLAAGMHDPAVAILQAERRALDEAHLKLIATEDDMLGARAQAHVDGLVVAATSALARKWDDQLAPRLDAYVNKANATVVADEARVRSDVVRVVEVVGGVLAALVVLVGGVAATVAVGLHRRVGRLEGAAATGVTLGEP